MADQPRKRPSTSTLLIGTTGAGKTSLLKTLAEYLWETYHKVLALASCDGGGFPAPVQALIYKGLIRAWYMPTRGYPFDTMDKATKGYWPAVLDPETAISPRGVRLIAPVALRYDIRCGQGHVMRRVYKMGNLTPMPCKECRKSIPVAEISVTEVVERAKGLENVGCVAIDSFTSAETWILEDMSERTGKLTLAGEKSALGGIIVDGPAGEFTAGGNNRAQVGFSQDRAAQWARNLNTIPGLVIPPIVTALTNEVSDSGLTVCGPKLAGQAKTDEAGQWFANCLECGLTKNADGLDVRRLWLQQFIDDRGVRHLIKHRAGPGTLPPWIEDPPDPENSGAQAFTGFNLGIFYKMLEDAVQAEEQRAADKYPDAPGLPSPTIGIAEDGADQPTPESPAVAGGPTAPTALAPPAPPAPPSAKAPKRMAPPRRVGPPTPPVPTPAVAASPAPVAPSPELPLTAATPPAPPRPVPSARPAPTPLHRPPLAPPPGRRPAPSPVRLTGGGKGAPPITK